MQPSNTHWPQDQVDKLATLDNLCPAEVATLSGIPGRKILNMRKTTHYQNALYRSNNDGQVLDELISGLQQATHVSLKRESKYLEYIQLNSHYAQAYSSALNSML
jgi:hypothetical protein